MEKEANFIKLGFDESCLTLLPKQYPFLIDPLNYPIVLFTKPAAQRVKAILAMLLELLTDWYTAPELILAHLNSLLTEINTVYFSNQKHLTDDKLSKFIAFKAYVAQHLTEQPDISEIAMDLGINTNALYQLTKQYAGVSPKVYCTNRLMLEAKRRIYHGEAPTIKQLAFSLGFNDPDYFSRLFKKVTRQSVARFSKDMSG